MTEKKQERTDGKRAGGFTLIELMVVLVIIGIFAAIAAPQLVEVSRRNKLTDLANMVQQSAGMVRTFALQTRRATVLEVGEGRMWINVLDGPTCWSDLKPEGRCKHNVGLAATESGTNRFDLLASDYVEAGAAMCGVELWYLDGSGNCAKTELDAAAALALCYSGEGDLFFRTAADDTGCEAGGGDGDTDEDTDGDDDAASDLAGQDEWYRACYDKDGGGANGAALRFNRFQGAAGECDAANALDVTRAVLVPMSGAPYGKVDL